MFDFMCGNISMALLHYQSGAEIFGKWKEKHGNEFGEGSVGANLSQLFANKHGPTPDDKQAWASDEKFRHFDSSAGERSGRTAFVSLAIARGSITYLTTEVQRLAFMEVMIRRNPNSVQLAFLVRQEEANCRANLDLWSRNFEAFPDSLTSLLTIEEEDEMARLRLMYFAALVWLWAGVSEQDDPLPLFVKHLDAADVVWNICCRHGQDSEAFAQACLTRSRDSTTWPAYAIIATRCEDPEITGRARELLVKASVKHSRSKHSSEIHKLKAS